MSRQAPTSPAILESHPKVRYFRETAPYASETGPPRPPCSCRLQTVPQPVGFEGDVQSPCRRPKFGRPLQPVDSGDWAGVVCLWRRVPLFDEFADALAAEFQEIRYTLHATRARAPLEFVDDPVRVFVGLYRRGRRRHAANVAVELQRPPLDQARQTVRKIRGPQESARRIHRVRRAREQPVRQYRLLQSTNRIRLRFNVGICGSQPATRPSS